MTRIDPAYAKRLSRAIEAALTRRYGREVYLKLLREAERQSAGPSVPLAVEAGVWQPREMGESTHDDRDAAE